MFSRGYNWNDLRLYRSSKKIPWKTKQLSPKQISKKKDWRKKTLWKKQTKNINLKKKKKLRLSSHRPLRIPRSAPKSFAPPGASLARPLWGEEQGGLVCFCVCFCVFFCVLLTFVGGSSFWCFVGFFFVIFCFFWCLLAWVFCSFVYGFLRFFYGFLRVFEGCFYGFLGFSKGFLCHGFFLDFSMHFYVFPEVLIGFSRCFAWNLSLS